MKLKGKVKKGLGNASFWVKKIEEVFYKRTGMKVFHGTLNIELEQPYELENYWTIEKDEYGGMYQVYVQECEILNQKAYIVRSTGTAHKSNIIEIVSDINFRESFNLNDGDDISIKVSTLFPTSHISPLTSCKKN